MILKINKETKVALLKAMAAGYLDTNSIPELQHAIDEARPDLKLAAMTDEDLDAQIEDLERKLERGIYKSK